MSAACKTLGTGAVATIKPILVATMKQSALLIATFEFRVLLLFHSSETLVQCHELHVQRFM